VALGATLYVVLMVLLVVLLFLWSDLALWLPRHRASGR
jgi:Tfp pilus assembly protein PilX